MKITLPHWAAVVAMVLGALALGSAQIPKLSGFSVILTTLGSFLIAGGASGVLVLPSISQAVSVAAVAKLDNAVPKVQAAIDAAKGSRIP